MSLTESLPYRVTRALHEDGERRAYLVDDLGIEEDYSALYAISSIRNAALSVSSVEAALNAINVLYAFSRHRGLDLVESFKAGRYLTQTDCHALCDFAQRSYGSEFKKRQKVVALGKVRRGYSYSMPTVARDTQFKRLTHIAEFIHWLATYLLPHSEPKRTSQIAAMRDDILGRRMRGGNVRGDFDDQPFTFQDNLLLNDLLVLGGERNPFDEPVQLRNLLLIELLRQLGVRGGEELSLQVRDVDHVRRELRVRRRHDAKDDPRVDQPLAKTRERALPLSVDLTNNIVHYVKQRRSIPGANKHPYLLVTHKAGPTQGQPMTKTAVKEVIETIRDAEPRLAHLTRHKLRHFFNNQLAHVQQQEGSDPNFRETHRRVRNAVAGRSPTSEVDAVYTELETTRQAREAVLATQERIAAKKPLARRGA